MPFLPEDVLNKNFTATQFRRGYDEHEVDDFLDEIVIELRRLSAESDDLNRQLSTCLEDKGVIAPDAKDKIAASRAAAEKAEKDAAMRIAKAVADAEKAEEQAAARKKDADKAADEAANAAAKSAKAAASAAAAVERAPAQPNEVGQTGMTSAAGVLALAEKLHTEYVTEGQQTRARLINEGQSHHDEVIGEATAKQAELRSEAQEKHDSLIAEATARHEQLITEATARHEQLITEARERATGMVAEAQQKRAELLQTLGHERSLLQRKIDELKIFERDYRARLRTHLEAQLHQLEGAGSEETAASEV